MPRKPIMNTAAKASLMKFAPRGARKLAILCPAGIAEADRSRPGTPPRASGGMAPELSGCVSGERGAGGISFPSKDEPGVEGARMPLENDVPLFPAAMPGNTGPPGIKREWPGIPPPMLEAAWSGDPGDNKPGEAG